MSGNEPISFETDVKPLFREKDREAMQWAFDLWSYADVEANADAIAARLRAGTMPCDGAWPQSSLETFEQWLSSGRPG